MSEETELLIEKVQKYVYLFDTSHEYYKNYIFYFMILYIDIYMIYITFYIIYCILCYKNIR
jgi:hypothetical protein